MGLMEPGCKLEDFDRLAQPAATNHLRCRALWVVFERYLREHILLELNCKCLFGLCMAYLYCILRNCQNLLCIFSFDSVLYHFYSPI